MKHLQILLWTLVILSFIGITSCKDDDPLNPLNIGAVVTVTNTLQSNAVTSGVETAIEPLFGLAEGDLAATSTISEAIEFPAYLLGLYDIDISESSISFELVAEVDDPNYSAFFRTLEAGTVDRYYLTFEDAQNVSGFSSTDSSVNLRIDSDKILVIEIGEGFNFNPGSTFTITLN